MPVLQNTEAKFLSYHGFQAHFVFDVQGFDFMEKSAVLKQMLQKATTKLPPIEKEGLVA